MSVRRSFTPGLLLLGSAAALLGTVFVAQVLWPEAESRPAVATASSGPAVEQPEAAPVSTPDYSAISERPLFVASRRMPEPQAEETVAAVPNRPVPPPVQRREVQRFPLKLFGVSMTRRKSQAYLKDPATGRIVTLSVGSKHDGWRLVQVTKDSATFTSGSRSETLKLCPAGKNCDGPLGG